VSRGLLNGDGLDSTNYAALLQINVFERRFHGLSGLEYRFFVVKEDLWLMKYLQPCQQGHTSPLDIVF
jgi:hypothetical protein